MEPLLVDIPDRIETARLVLRAANGNEAAEINQAIVESIDELRPWMPWATPTPALKATEIYCRASLAKHILRSQIDYRVYHKESGVFAGNFGFPRLNWKIPMFEIGYWLRTSMARKGYATEAVVALTAFAFKSLGANRVMIQCEERNLRSRRVAERAGFQLEGILRNDERTYGNKLRDTCIYAVITNPGGDC